MDIITKEFLNSKDPFGTNCFLKCDIPIWEEFAIDFEYQGGWAPNSNFTGVRGLYCKVPNINHFRDVYIVTHNPKTQQFFINAFLSVCYQDCKNLNIVRHNRKNKLVYVIDYEYGE